MQFGALANIGTQNIPLKFWDNLTKLVSALANLCF